MKLTGIFATGSSGPLANVGLLVLRVWIGLTMFFNHGWDKLTHFSTMSKEFADPLHVGSTTSLALAIFAEVICSALLVLGLVTRFAALVLAINMAVAFVLVHKMLLSGEHNGEMAFIYLACYVALVIAGPGRFSNDAIFFKS